VLHFIVTLNGECSSEKADEIKDAGMAAYVPEQLKSKEHLKNKSCIRPLSDLPKDVKKKTQG